MHAPRIEKVKIDPSQIGMLIGKGGETIRGLCEEFESQIDVNDDGQVLIYSANGELADALVERIRTMMKEVEIGDEYLGKVVKTTTFGAFIELSKGTDGLLHISNVSPGNRVDTVEEVLSKGDEITVRVVEVDRERGRIGVRRSDDPEIAGKSIEELATLPGTGGGGGGDRGPRRPREGGREGGRDGGSARLRPPAPPRQLAATASRWRNAHVITELPGGVRVVTERVPAVRSVALGFWIGSGSRTESEAEAGLSHLLEHMLFRGTARYRSEEIDQIFDAMGAELNAGTGKEMTSVYARVLDEHLERAFDVIAQMISEPTMHGLAEEREVVLEEIAMYEDDPQELIFDVLGETIFPDSPLGRTTLGRAEVVGAATREELQTFHRERYSPGNIVIAAAGSVEHERVVGWAGEALRRARATRRRRGRSATAASGRPALPARAFASATPSSTT